MSQEQVIIRPFRETSKDKLLSSSFIHPPGNARKSESCRRLFAGSSWTNLLIREERMGHGLVDILHQAAKASLTKISCA